MKPTKLSESELLQYARQLIIPGIGEAGQQKLKDSRVLVVGAGGLGCPLLQYLCAAGVGHIGIVEYDIVSESNLHRQILYGPNDVGKAKSEVIRKKLNQQNSNVSIEIFNTRFDNKNALSLTDNYDIIVDASDNYETRYIINDACVINSKTMVHGAIYLFEAQVSVFNYNNGPTYRCYNPYTNKDFSNPDPSQTGLLGVLPGICGTYMANEVIKIILGLDEVLSGTVLLFNILKNSFYTVAVNKNPNNTLIKNLDISFH